MKKSPKKRLKTFGQAIVLFVAVAILYFGYKIIIILVFQQILHKVNPPKPLPAFPPQRHKPTRDKEQERKGGGPIDRRFGEEMDTIAVIGLGDQLPDVGREFVDVKLHNRL
jgi:hypothetical protein